MLHLMIAESLSLSYAQVFFLLLPEHELCLGSKIYDDNFARSHHHH